MARNKDYWARRAKRTQDAILDRVFEEYVARVQEAYTDAIHAMDAKMRTWIQRLADNNEISYADAQKLLAKNELEEFHWSVEQYIKHGTDNLDGQWSKQLENASARVHISRYDAMKFELQALAKEATGKTIGTIKDAAALAYTESYNHTAFDLQQQVGVGVSMQGVDSRKLEHVLNRPWSDDGKTFSARCWEGCDNLVSKVNRELFRMVATGEKPDRAIAAIADEFGKSKRTAGRLVMTESAAIASQAQHDCYTELGVEEFEVIGTFDAHMCDFCGEMDGKHFPESKRKIGENAPPFHPWCRCTTAPYDEDLKGVGTRWMRDPETGKGGYVPSDMTYQEWKGKYVDKTGESGIINTDAMASTDKIQWPKKGKELSGSQKRELTDYANSKGIVLKGLTGSDVDPVLIKEAIDDAEMMISRIPQLNDNPQRPFTIKVVNGLSANTFAQTNRYTTTNVVQLNANAFRSKAALEKEYAKLVSEKWFPQGTTYRSIIPHECGHMYTQKNRIDGFSTAKSVLRNMYGNEYNIDEASAFLKKNLSEYASTEKDHLCEMVAESFNAHFSKTANNSFADNVVKYLLGGE